MLNSLRSDLYRLKRTHSLLTPLGALAGIALILCLTALASRIASGEAPDARGIGESFLNTAAALGMDARFLPIACSIPALSLVASDLREGGIKNCIAAGGSRRSYVNAKLAIALFYSLAAPALFLACLAVLPGALGLVFASQPDAGAVAIWLICASASCFCYSALAIACAVFARSEAGAWITGFLIMTGIIEAVLVQALMILGGLAGKAALNVTGTIAGVLPLSATSALGIGFDTAIASTNLLSCAALPLLAWACLAFVASRLRFARKTLS